LKKLKFWSKRLYRRSIQLVGSQLYLNPDSDIGNSILVAGTARSGTTWLGDLIASEIPCRIMFEPFNPDLVPAYRPFNTFQYLQPGQEYPEFYAFARKVFTGEIRNSWIDRYNELLFPKYRLIKEIRANLALKWLHDNFHQVPMILLMRHPCAVVLSRLELEWATDKDIDKFLSQPDLKNDFLGDYLDFIHSVKTDEEKHAIIWSITNLVPLKQFVPDEIKIVFYEDLCTQPEVELPALFASIGHPYTKIHADKINRPSQTTRETSAVVSGTDKIIHWKKRLKSSQIDNILRVVEAFHLDYIYGDSIFPVNRETH
jgi:hypothetical protein